MPTVRGWALLGAGLALTSLWALLGHDTELLLTGAFLITAALIGIAWVHVAGVSLTATRRLSPAAVHEGESVTASITIQNAGRFPIAGLSLVDEIRRLGSAMFETSGLKPGSSATGTYRVICRPRGVYTVGPATATATDPLGLAEVSAVASVVERLVVYPHVEDLEGLPSRESQGAPGTRSTPDRARKGGEDFYTLRQYQLGDDLRRVHWPWSAKTDELMIRQLQSPLLSQALIYLDTRAVAYASGHAFEDAVRGTASALAHLVRAGLVTETWLGGSAPGRESSYRAAMEHLATVTLNQDTRLVLNPGQIEGMSAGSVLVVVTGAPDRGILDLMKALRSRRAVSILMVAASSTPQMLGEFRNEGVATVLSAQDGTWARGWQSAVQGSWDAASAK